MGLGDLQILFLFTFQTAFPIFCNLVWNIKKSIRTEREHNRCTFIPSLMLWTMFIFCMSLHTSLLSMSFFLFYFFFFFCFVFEFWMILVPTLSLHPLWQALLKLKTSCQVPEVQSKLPNKWYKNKKHGCCSEFSLGNPSPVPEAICTPPPYLKL